MALPFSAAKFTIIVIAIFYSSLILLCSSNSVNNDSLQTADEDYQLFDIKPLSGKVLRILVLHVIFSILYLNRLKLVGQQLSF